MEDAPTALELLQIVAVFLRDETLPQLQGAAAFQLRVAVNAIELAARQLATPPGQAEAERQRLAQILGHDGSLRDLTAELADNIRNGKVTTQTPGLARHLWLTACAKVCVDQPTYGGLRRALALAADNDLLKE